MKNRFHPAARQIFVSVITGAAAAYALVFYYFNANNSSNTDRLFLFTIPAISAAICIYYSTFFVERAWLQAAPFIRRMLFLFASISALMIAIPANVISPLYSVSAFISLLAIFLTGAAPTAAALQKIVEAKKYFQLLAGWAFSTALVFLITDFLDNFYGSFIEIIFITLILHLILGAWMFSLVKRLGNFAKNNKLDFLLLTALFIALLTFVERFFQYGAEAPDLLIPQYFLPNKSLLPSIGATSVLFIPWQAWILGKLEVQGFREKFKRTKLHAFIEENMAGITLALAFFGVYLMISTVLNQPRFDVDDIFFDADGMNWRLRLTTDNWHDFYWRSVHPFVLLLLKPPVDLIAMLLKGNKLFGAYVVIALGGATCVFLAWKFIYRVTGNIVYSSLMASILGFSASHLVFGSLIETYIFLAAGLLLFFLFLLEEKPMPALVLASLPVIGITHSNFAQNALAFFTMKPNLKALFQYVAAALILLVQLSLVSNLFFPDAQPFFFIPSALLAEEQNIFPLNTLRMEALTRVFAFSNVVAPTPILYRGDIPFTQFRFFKPEINKLSMYETPLQTFTSWFWMGLLLLGVIVFILKFRDYKTNRLSLALLGSMALNVGLHLRYGKELFLYSANWTYALILLFALALQGLSKYRWLQITLLVFVFFLMLTNSWLFDTFFYVLTE